ncbi:MAG: hypothetical protein U9N56_00375 [Actinomycetota bacterium]|nr:hypothetical protein [Actinomycetota bacterium]
MYRRSGLIVLVLGALVTYVLVFTPFDQEVRRYTRNDDGDRVRATVVCPDSWGMLYGEDEADVRYCSDAEYCLKGSRLRVTSGVVLMAVALTPAIMGLWRGPHPELIHLGPLSEIFEQPRRPGSRHGPSG